VLGEPDRYATVDAAGRTGADTHAFFFNPDLRIAELAGLGDDLAKDCDRCERTARGRIRRLAVRTWIGKPLIKPLKLTALGPSDLDVCKRPHPAWEVPDGVENDQFSYGVYSAARFGTLARDAVGLLNAGPADPDDPWSCYLGTLETDERPVLTTGVSGLQLKSPGALDAGGRRGLITQLGVHALLKADPVMARNGDPSHAACARVVRAELAHVTSPHPLFLESDTDPGSTPGPAPRQTLSLCGQVCAGYFGLAPAEQLGWTARAEDLTLCTTGAVTPWSPARLCEDATLRAPRTTAERTQRLECLPSLKDPSALCKDALLPSRDRLRSDWEGGLTTCGPTADAVAETRDEQPGFRRGGAAGILYESEELVAAPVSHALPRMVSACALRLLEQDLEEAGVPPLLPENIAQEQIARTIEATAGRLAGTNVEQSSRRVCEEAGAFCSLSAALLVRRPDLLWNEAISLAGPDTAENFAIAMGPLLMRNYRAYCDDGAPANQGVRKARRLCTGSWVDERGHGDVCTAVCESGAFGFRLAAQHADAETRLAAAFRLTTATHMCVGLADFLDADERDLTWETACFEGLKARSEVALSLLTDGSR
jgi:hypothetical protein